MTLRGIDWPATELDVGAADAGAAREAAGAAKPIVVPADSVLATGATKSVIRRRFLHYSFGPPTNRGALMHKLMRAMPLAVALAMSMPACSEGSPKKSGQSVSFEEYREGQLSQFQRLDGDSDGIVQYGPLPKKVAKRLRRMDADRNGDVTRAEFERGMTMAFGKADANGDGTLEVAEQH